MHHEFLRSVFFFVASVVILVLVLKFVDSITGGPHE